MSDARDDKRGEVLLCCASGEGSHQFKVVADEAGVMAFLEEMCGGEQDGTMTHSLAHYRDEDNWSNGGTAYNVQLYCAEFSVWKVLPGELAFTPSHVAQKPVAFVPLHPRNGPLWANTVPSLDADRPAHYNVMPLYAEETTPSTTPRICSRGGAHEIDQCHKCGAIFAASATERNAVIEECAAVADYLYENGADTDGSVLLVDCSNKIRDLKNRADGGKQTT